MSEFSSAFNESEANSTSGFGSPAGLMEHQNSLTEQLNDEMTRAVLPVTVFVGLEMVLGFFGNLLVLYVFLFRYHVCNFRYFVLCLAFVDITSSLTTMPGEIVTQLFWYIYPVPVICKVKSFFNVFTVSVEAFCLLTIAIDRYLKVCRPFGWQIKPRIAIILCCVIYFLAFILAVPVAIFWGTHSFNTTYMDTTIEVTVCEKDQEFEQTNRPLHYSLSFEVIVSVCLLIMFVLYVLVAKKLFKDKRNRTESKRTKKPVVSLSTTYSGVPTDPSSENSSNDAKQTRTEKENKHKLGKTIKTVVSDSCLSSETDEPMSDVRSGAIRKYPYPIWSDTEDESDSRVQFDILEKQRNSVLINEMNKHTNNDLRKSKHQMNQHHKRTNKAISARVRRKTLIMFILTIVFIVTTVLYMTLLSFIARSDDILQKMSNGEKAVYFFFFRLYFINHVINPLVYGILDPKFRKVMTSFRRKG